MSLLLNHVNVERFAYINVLKDKIAIALTLAQKKVAFIVLAILNLVATLCYFTYRHCFKATKLEDEESNIPDINETDPSDFAQKVHSATMSERLEKNRKYAADQQAKEEAKGFFVIDGTLSKEN